MSEQFKQALENAKQAERKAMQAIRKAPVKGVTPQKYTYLTGKRI